MKENTLELSFEMYEELKETLIKTLRTELAEARPQSTAAIDADTIMELLQTISDRQEQISEDLGAQISEIDEKVVEMEIPEELPPRMVQHRFALSLDATRNFWLFMSMFIVIAVQSVGLYLEWRPDRGRYDNDLKYRYVLMKVRHRRNGCRSWRRCSRSSGISGVSTQCGRMSRSTNAWYVEGRLSTSRRD